MAPRRVLRRSVHWSFGQGGTGPRAVLSRAVAAGHLGLPVVEPQRA